MARAARKSAPRPRRVAPRLKRPLSDGSPFKLAVAGFKAVRDEIVIDVAPITLISGANSSGKSSFIQPLLLLKQTLEAPFDPGALLLHGPNVKFTDQSQVLSRGRSKSEATAQFSVSLAQASRSEKLTFRSGVSGFEIHQDTRQVGDLTADLQLNPNANQLSKLQATLSQAISQTSATFNFGGSKTGNKTQLGTERNRCFIDPTLAVDYSGASIQVPLFLGDELGLSAEAWSSAIQGIIHVPGLRGNPERSYQRSAVGSVYPGTFETYVASIIHSWSEPNQTGYAPEKLAALSADLQRLELTWKVQARRVDDASLEILVGRLPHAQQGGAHDLVSVADVGFGVSQTLPVLVALHAARKGQIVYIEQPEIHLHPRAQLALAESFVQAALRGVYLILETHSSLIIRGIQTEIARGNLAPAKVSMNWFSRDQESGTTQSTAAKIDPSGRLGEWPLDFDDVAQAADWAYLDAVSVGE